VVVAQVVAAALAAAVWLELMELLTQVVVAVVQVQAATAELAVQV
jgi:hypothetical protein